MTATLEVLRLPADRDRWLGLLSRVRDHDIYHRPEYLALFDDRTRPAIADAFSGRPCLFVLEDDSGLALHPMLERRLDGLPCLEGRSSDLRDLVSPYGYAGPLLESDGSDDRAILAARFTERCTARCRADGMIAEFVRFHPVLGNETHPTGTPPDRRGDVVVVDLRQDDARLLAAMSRTTRSMIRSASRRGIEVTVGDADGPATLERLYLETMRRRDAAPEYDLSPGFFASMVESLGDSAALFVARESGRVAAAAIFLACGPHASYAFAGTAATRPIPAASRAIVYAAMRWARDRGCLAMLLGGGLGAGDHGLFRFKRSFSPILRPFHTASRIHLPEAYSELATRRRWQLERGEEWTRRGPDYFPEYRR